MARLDDVVGAILRDLSGAQDTATRYTRLLALEYGGDPLLRHFPVPCTKLTDVELELRFAPRRTQQSIGDRERAVARAREVFHPYANAASENIVSAAAGLFARARTLAEFPQSLIPEVQANLESDQFTAYLAKAIEDDLFAKRDELVKPPAGLNIDGVAQSTIETAARVVIDHPDLKRFFAANEAFAKEALTAVRTALTDPLASLEESFPTPSLLDPEYELDVITELSELRDLPASALSTLRIKATMNGYRWVITPEGEPNQLLQEG